MKWKDKVSVLVTDETGRSKQGWNLYFGFYLKSNRKLFQGFGQVRNMIRLYFRYVVRIGMERMDDKAIRTEAKRLVRGQM